MDPGPTPYRGSPGLAGPPDLVTGDAVALDLQVARLPTRMLSFAIDVAVQAALGIACAAADGLWLRHATRQLVTAVVLTELVGCLVAYPLVMETLTRGRTLGKLALGLRTVRDDGGGIGFAQALVRALAGVADFWSSAFVVALVVAATNSRGRRLGDLLAGTVVVRERTPTRVVGPPPMPPGLAGWASTLQLAVLPDALVRAGRSYLERLPALDPAAAADRGRALAAAVAAVTAPLPPPGVPPVPYLQAVLAERHRRAMAGLRADPADSPYPAPRPHPAGGPYPAPRSYPAVDPHPPVDPGPPAPGGFALPR